MFSQFARTIDFLEIPWVEKKFIHKINDTVPSITKISGVDGGLITEALAGLDLILYRAVGVTFHGIGKKVEAVYTPNFDPEPMVYLAPSLPSRQEFLKLATLYRLLVEYEIAIETIKFQNPTVLFIDGKVIPLSSDFQELNNQSKNVTTIEMAVKAMYRDLVNIAHERNVLLCGVIKDSRSRNLSLTFSETIPEWIRTKVIISKPVKGWRVNLSNMLDHTLCDGILHEGERTAWLRSHPPKWVSLKHPFEIWSTMVKPIKEDQAIKIEIIKFNDLDAVVDIALGALSILSKHGLPIAIPTIILEADDRVKLSGDYLENIVNEISVSFGIPRDELRKRRAFRPD